MNIRKIVSDTLRNNGITIDSEGNEPTTGYVVSLPGCEFQTPIIDEIIVRTYVARNLELLSRFGVYLGTWKYDGQFYLDCSVVVPTLRAALLTAKVNGQLSIFDIVRGECIDA